MAKEKRTYARTSLYAVASICKDDRLIVGEVKNLSMNGAYVSVAEEMRINDLVTVSIYHSLTPQSLSDLEARVVRVTECGVGLQFKKTLIE